VWDVQHSLDSPLGINLLLISAVTNLLCQLESLSIRPFVSSCSCAFTSILLCWNIYVCVCSINVSVFASSFLPRQPRSPAIPLRDYQPVSLLHALHQCLLFSPSAFQLLIVHVLLLFYFTFSILPLIKTSVCE
jgi:hypothetical protein